MPTGFNVHTGSDVQSMLEVMGLHSVEQLFADVPAQVRLRRELDLPPALSEWELMRDVRSIAAMNSTVLSHNSFLGCGAYEHYIPAVVDAIVSRGEFLTAYTPYQPEMSQGLLQALFEFQVLLGRLRRGSCHASSRSALGIHAGEPDAADFRNTKAPGGEWQSEAGEQRHR